VALFADTGAMPPSGVVAVREVYGFYTSVQAMEFLAAQPSVSVRSFS
jgi:hypothetical protein